MTSKSPLATSWRTRLAPDYRAMLERTPYEPVRRTVLDRLYQVPSYAKRDQVEMMIDLVTTAAHMLDTLQTPERPPAAGSFEALGFELTARAVCDLASETQAFALLTRADRLFEQLCTASPPPPTVDGASP